MSVADAKRALQACEDGIALITAQQKSNQVLTDDYNDKLRAWESRRNAHNQKYGNWENKRGEYSKYGNYDARQEFNSNETDWSRDCSVCWSSCNYPSASDWADGNCKRWAQERGLIHSDEYYYNGKWWHDNDGGDGACGKKKVRYQCDRRPNKIEEWKNDYFKNKPTFTEGEPQKPAQNLTSINLACCANVSNIVGSQVDQTIINQQNNCLQDKRSEIEKAAQREAAAEKAAAEKEAFEKATAEKVAAQKAAAAQKVTVEKVAVQKVAAQKEKDNLTIVIGGTGIIFIFCISIILVILLLVLSE
jgi:hypothetical protein